MVDHSNNFCPHAKKTHSHVLSISKNGEKKLVCRFTSRPDSNPGGIGPSFAGDWQGDNRVVGGCLSMKGHNAPFPCPEGGTFDIYAPKNVFNVGCRVSGATGGKSPGRGRLKKLVLCREIRGWTNHSSNLLVLISQCSKGKKLVKSRFAKAGKSLTSCTQKPSSVRKGLAYRQKPN